MKNKIYKTWARCQVKELNKTCVNLLEIMPCCRAGDTYINATIRSNDEKMFIPIWDMDGSLKGWMILKM